MGQFQINTSLMQQTITEIISKLAQLPQPLMTYDQSSFGSAMPMAMTTTHHNNHVQLPVSRNVRWTFDVDHVKMATSGGFCSPITQVREHSTESASRKVEYDPEGTTETPAVSSACCILYL